MGFKYFILFSFYLKSAYHHIEIFSEHHTYLGCACDFGTAHSIFCFPSFSVRYCYHGIHIHQGYKSIDQILEICGLKNDNVFGWWFGWN